MLLEATFALETLFVLAASIAGTPLDRLFVGNDGVADVVRTITWIGLMGVCAAFIRTAVTFVACRVAPDRMRKWKTRAKLGDQAWQLCMHATLAMLEVDALGIDWYRISDWKQPVDYVWEHPYDPLDDGTRRVYQAHVVVWIFSGLSHCLFEERRKDYDQMLLHHCVTLGLVFGSYRARTTRIGLLVMAIHDVSDIPLDILKCANYLKLEGPRNLFIVEISFVVTLMFWAILRLYVFPVHVVWTLGWKGSATHVSTVRRADYELYYILNGLLSILSCLHVWWYSLMCRILVRLIGTESPHAAGDREYEGDEDD